MNDKENRSLAKQVELIMKAIKQFKEPPSIHLCSFEGGIKQQMQKMGYEYWAVTVHQENLVQTGKEFNKKLVYLSPDAQLELESVDKGSYSLTQIKLMCWEDWQIERFLRMQV